MLNKHYLVEDDSWKDYPTARSLEKRLRYPEDFKGYREPETDSLLKRVAASLGRTIFSKGFLSKKEFEAMTQLMQLGHRVVTQVQVKLKLTLDTYMNQERLWLLDDFGHKLMSGFFDVLLVDQSKRIGIVVRHVFHQNGATLRTKKEDTELIVLALIATEAFDLKEVTGVTLSFPDFSSARIVYTRECLQAFKEELIEQLKSNC